MQGIRWSLAYGLLNRFYIACVIPRMVISSYLCSRCQICTTSVDIHSLTGAANMGAGVIHFRQAGKSPLLIELLPNYYDLLGVVGP